MALLVLLPPGSTNVAGVLKHALPALLSPSLSQMIAAMAADQEACAALPLARISDICLSLPETAANDQHPPHRGFIIAGKKNFAWYTEDEHGSGRTALCVRAAAGENDALVGTDPERFGLPKYVARHGWVNYYLDLPDRDIDWAELRELVLDSYRLQAPRRLVSALAVGTPPPE